MSNLQSRIREHINSTLTRPQAENTKNDNVCMQLQSQKCLPTPWSVPVNEEGPVGGILFPFPFPNFYKIPLSHCTNPVVAVPVFLKS